MVTVEFLGPIAKEPMKVDIKNLNDLANILKDDCDVATWLESCAVAVNDVMVCSKEIELNDGDKVSLLPPVCGG